MKIVKQKRESLEWIAFKVFLVALVLYGTLLFAVINTSI